MTGLPEVSQSAFPALSLSGEAAKFYRDVWTVLELKVRYLLAGWYLYVIRPLVFPLGMFYFLRSVAPDDPDVVRRLMTGAIVFGFALSTTNMLAQQLIMDRFLGRLKLLITMPMAKSAYATGVLVFATIQTIPIVVLVLVVASFAGVDFSLTWAFFPLNALILLTMAGLTLVIASYAPSMEAGSVMANLFGIVLVVISPVFYTMDQAPAFLKWLGWVSPMRYAADGITKSITGDTGVGVELAVLAGFATVTLALGLWKLRWREE